MARTRGASVVQTRSGPSPLQHGLREGIVIGLLAFSAYLLLAIATYSVGDPGWSSTGNGSGVVNAGGAAGAWIADVLLSLFGYIAYLLPVLIGYRAWVLVREREEPLELDWLLVSIRAVGCVLVVLAGTGLLGLEGDVRTLLPFGVGGMLGSTISQVCQHAFGIAGSELLLVSLL
ncbi:MAG: DNA translocase FtsK 4TM domain-containing protein, partial [Gammaproteobacteria bacterium]